MNGEKQQIFVKVEDYKDLLDILTLTRDKIKRARFMMDKIDQLKRQEDAEIDAWLKELEEIENKLKNIDRKLFKSEVL